MSAKKGIFQIILLISLAGLCGGGFVLGRYVLQLPFNKTNAQLNKEGTAFTLNFLIPAGVYLDDEATIGDVIRMKLKKTSGPFEGFLRMLSDQIPSRYRHLANVLLFLFWTLCFLSFLRIFTFMSYGRALRTSLLLGGIVYYFVPDLSPGSGDDVLFILFPILVIAFRFYLVRRKREKEKIFSRKSRAAAS